MNQEEELESNQRTVEEIEAISIIYDHDEDEQQQKQQQQEGYCDNDTIPFCQIRFHILSKDYYEQLQQKIAILEERDECLHSTSSSTHTDNNEDDNISVELQLHIRTQIVKSPPMTTTIKAIAQITLPKGYPMIKSASVSIVSIDTLSRKQRDDIGVLMNEKAKLMLDSGGTEALMDLIQDFESFTMERLGSDSDDTTATNQSEIQDGCIDKNNNTTGSNNNNNTSNNNNSSNIFSRRWIWVHHITKNSRCKDIVEEANNFSLHGYLKSGYPGIVVIEGISHSCDEFVSWIKGNKSRPGGFGRNWGHHVRGQIEDCDEKLKLSSSSSLSQNVHNTTEESNQTFFHLGEDLKLLAAQCKEADVEDEFLTYIMQH